MTLVLADKCWDNPTPRLMARQEMSRTAGGVTLTKDLGPALWRLDLVSKPLPSIEAGALYAQIMAARNESIVVRARAYRYIDGFKVLLPGVTVGSVTGGKITFSGLPGFVVVPAGTIFHTVTGGNYQLFQLQDASNTSGGARVLPEMRGVQVGDDVGLTPPNVALTPEPGSIDIQDDIKGRKRVLFSGVQVIL